MKDQWLMISFLVDKCETGYSLVSQCANDHTTVNNLTKSLINRLRFHATECRSAARLDIFEACKLFDTQKPLSEDYQLDIFVRTLGQATCKSIIWYKPGCEVYSFDEKWVMAIFRVYKNDDFMSYDFMVRSRISTQKRKIFSLMVANLSQILIK